MASKGGRLNKPAGAERDQDDAKSAGKWAIGEAVGFIPGVGWLAQQALGLVTSKFEADEKYKKFLPVIKALIKYEGRDSANVKTMLEELANLASFGAQRLNFRNHYVDRPEGWKELPDDPNKIPYGFWY